jgi:hypothetical protein
MAKPVKCRRHWIKRLIRAAILAALLLYSKRLG